MESRNEIAVELRALSELVSGLDRHTPYGVPDGYFDRFPDGMVSRLAAGPDGRPILTTSTDSPTFSVPEGYFDGLAAQVLSRLKAGAAGGQALETQPFKTVSEELAGLSTIVAGITRKTPYRLPEGYFGELSPILSVIRETPAYHVPEEYFGELSPILAVAGERSTYRVPDGYFEALPQVLVAKVDQGAAAEQVELVSAGSGKAAKVVAISRGEYTHPEKVLKGNWWKYASVASIAACFLLIFSWPQPDTHAGSKRMVSPEVAMQQGLQTLTDQELQAYLDDQHSFVADPAASSTATLDMNEGEVKSLLSEASDSDLQQYMEQHGNVEDLATN